MGSTSLGAAVSWGESEELVDRIGRSTNDGSTDDTASSGDDLTATTVNGIGVESHIVDVEADTADVLVAENTLLGGPLESSNDAVLDLEKVLEGMRMRSIHPKSAII